MPFDETHTTQPKTTYDLAVEAEKRRSIAEYQAQFRRECGCHCHLAEQGVACRCIKECAHCGSRRVPSLR
jgi:hypothetical protein